MEELNHSAASRLDSSTLALLTVTTSDKYSAKLPAALTCMSSYFQIRYK